MTECWVCVNADGTEQIREKKPKRFFGTKEEHYNNMISYDDSKKKDIWITDYDYLGVDNFPRCGAYTMVLNLPNGTIEKILGYALTWDDNAVKL